MPHKDPEARRTYMKEYVKRYRKTAAGKAKLYAGTLKWRKKNWDKHLATAKRYREAHPDRVKESMYRVDQKPHRVQKRIDYWNNLDAETKRKYIQTGARNHKLKKARNGGTCKK